MCSGLSESHKSGYNNFEVVANLSNLLHRSQWCQQLQHQQDHLFLEQSFSIGKDFDLFEYKTQVLYFPSLK